MNKMGKLVDILEVIGKKDADLGKKKVQKLMYLMERKGLELELNYRIHFFGPYSSKLDDSLHTLKNLELIEIDTTEATHVVKVLNKDINAEEHLMERERAIVDLVIKDFGSLSAFDLEAITTLDYVANSLDTNDETIIIDKVLEIKGSKFKEPQLSDYFATLKKYNYL